METEKAIGGWRPALVVARNGHHFFAVEIVVSHDLEFEAPERYAKKSKPVCIVQAHGQHLHDTKRECRVSHPSMFNT